MRELFDTIGAAMSFLMERTILNGIEGARRAVSRLDPRTYTERMRVRTVTAGEAEAKSDRFAVFLVYMPSAIPAYTMNFIDALGRAGYNVVIVSNAVLGEGVRADLLLRSCLLIERSNIGRDFGAYKDAITVLYRRYPNVSRLIIANDSVYYLKKGLDDLVAALNGPEDFIGVSEVYEHHYHVASFLMSFSLRVLNDPAFRTFWRNYRPIQTRMWAIIEGEGKLTSCLVNAGYRPHILFKAEHLLSKLQALSMSERTNIVRLFPATMRAALMDVAHRTESDLDSFADAAVFETLQRNQMHAAGFAFMKFLGLPLFKRDIVYRELYTIAEVRQIMAELGVPMQAEIAADLDRRQPPRRGQFLRRLLFDHGFA